MRQTGIYETLGDLRYFVPNSLPPQNPTLQLTPEIMNLYSDAIYNLGKLNEIGHRVPDKKRFINSYVIKEALLSSAIEGIHTTIIDVFTCADDSSITLNKNTQLVINYIQALEGAMTLMQKENLPVCSRVILAAHKMLLSGTENNATPGIYRKQTVKVGNLIPVIAPKISELMSDLEKYINEDESLPILIKAGLAHLQFETIHPFLDGNGRIGRLLILLIIMDGKLLDTPILYLSYYFKKNHAEYYQKLDRVRTHGDFEGWITYYLQAIKYSAIDASLRAKDIENLEVTLIQTIQKNISAKQTQQTALTTLSALFAAPVFTTPQLSKNINKVYNSTQNIIKKFIDLGIVTEQKDTNAQRNKQYRFTAYLNLLEKEYE